MDTVPTELGALILSNVADVGSLWAFVRASRRIYFLFNEYRERILSDVIAREVGPALMGEALAALSSSRFTSDQHEQGGNTRTFFRGPPKSEALAWIENCYIPKSDAFRWVENFPVESDKLKWGERYKRPGANPQTMSPPPTDMLLLWELHKDVEFIADIYVRGTLPIFNQIFPRIHTQSGNKQLPHTFESLSGTETQRIFRAIYRFVIFSNVFAPSSSNIWEEEELFEYFLCRFTAWQVEEIRCINDFVTDTILKKWQEMEDNEFNRLAADSSLWEIDPRPDPWNCRWDADFFSKSSKSFCFEDMQECVATLPIKDLRAMFQAEGQILEDLVKGWTWGARRYVGLFLGEDLRVDRQFLPIIPDGEVLRQFSQQSAWRNGSMPSFDRATDGDDAASANTGWYWTHDWHAHKVYGDDTISTDSLGYEDQEEFRRFGYVFWDAQRWQCIGTTNAKSLVKKTLGRFPRPRFDDQSLSVEERIRELAGCECGDVIRPEDTTCKIKGHKVRFTYPCGPGVVGEEV